MMDKKKLLAEKIKDRLKELEVSRSQFAGMMKVHPSVVTRWLSGIHNFQMFTLFEIEKALNSLLFNYGIPNQENQFIDEFI